VDKREALKIKHHLSEKLGMKVIKRPIRVLLFAAARQSRLPFVRSLLVREMEKKSLELAICLQPPPARLKYREGVVQDVPKERMLTYFPTLRQEEGPVRPGLLRRDRLLRSGGTGSCPSSLQILSGGRRRAAGSVVLGGYINTVELIRPRRGGTTTASSDPRPAACGLDDRRDYSERNTDDPCRGLRGGHAGNGVPQAR